MEYNINEQSNLGEENINRKAELHDDEIVPYDMELGYGHGIVPCDECSSMYGQRNIDYRTEYEPSDDSIPYESEYDDEDMIPYEVDYDDSEDFMPFESPQYNVPNSSYRQTSNSCQMCPQSMYRQRDVLPLLLLGLGAFGFNDEYGGYNPYYYPPYYPSYYPPYYPPYYSPYNLDYHHHRNNQ